MPDPRTLPATAYLLVGALAMLLGAVILRENARERIHRVTAVMLILVGLKAAYEGILYSNPAVGEAIPRYVFLNSLGYLWEFFFPTLLLFASIFPSEHPYLSRVRFSVPLLYLPHSFHFLLLLFVNFVGDRGVPMPEAASRIDSLRVIFRLAIHALNLLISIQLSLFSLVNIGYVVAAVILLFTSFRASANQRLRGQLRIITLGLGSCVGLYTIAEPAPTLLGTALSAAVRQALVVVALTLGAGSIAYSIVRYRFLDTQLLARRSILYAAVTAVLVGLYLTIVRQLQQFLAGAFGIGVAVVEPVFLVLALILFQPVLMSLEEMIDRFFLRDRHDHRNILRNLSRDVITILDRNELIRKIVSTLSEGFLARHVTFIDFGVPEGERVSAIDLRPEEKARMEAAAADLRDLPSDLGLIHRDQLAGQAVAWGASILDLLERLDLEYLLPVRHGSEPFGVILLGRKETGVAYTGEEVSLLETLANQLGVALQNASLYRQSLEKAVLEEELSLARTIQQRLLPARAPAVAPFSISARNVPSKQVGGDFYDLVDLKDGRVLVAIADVAGKGVPAALLTSMLQSSLRTQVSANLTPAVILRNLNELTYQFTAADQFATFFLGILDSRDRSFVYANAGHNYPVLLKRDGGLVPLDNGGLLLGAFPGASWPEERMELGVGDLLVLYTDGVTEARPPHLEEEYGERRFQEHLHRKERAGAHEIAESILADVAGYAGADQADDITLIVVRVEEA